MVTNDKGQYSFPAGRLEPGKYTITIRAVGYVLDGPKTVEVAAGGTPRPTSSSARPRTSPRSCPTANGSSACRASGQAEGVPHHVLGCHTLQRVFTSPHSADEWEQVFNRMGRYSPGSTPAQPQPLLPGPRGERPRGQPAMQPRRRPNISSASASAIPRPTEYDFKTLPRPKGRATKVIVTEYDLPRKEALPHDVVVDADGKAWYSDFGHQFVGELDPKTGKVTDNPIPVLKRRAAEGHARHRVRSARQCLARR